ncbi:GntR family transcriptional regulator [Herbiconiux sp. A18JL235]|uniref:GntR family transcriptional regulator n=1 Tax=Herbiconiux sp. A18JL235 TaxID=3152363 RepID=A0AB39BD87_9MICO
MTSTEANPPPVVRELRTVSAVDAVGDDLRRRMFAGELVGGELLKEAVVAAEYGVSRSTAKAAIEKLTAEGLLERSANRSARVPRLTAADVHDIYRTRLRLESSALRELAAARRAPREAAEANARVRAAGAAVGGAGVAGTAGEPGSAGRAPSVDGEGASGAVVGGARAVGTAGGPGSAIASVEPDMRFHAALVEAIGSERLERMYGSLVGEARLCMVQVQGRSLLAVDRIADEHDEILRRLAAGDADGAVEVLTVHLTRASERLEAALDA